MEFIGQIPNYHRNTVETVRMAIASRQILDEMAASEGIDFHREPRGILHVYRDKHSFDGAAKVNALLAEGGLERVAVTPAEMRALEPALTGEFYGGFFTASDYTGDIHAFTRGLAEACLRHGATFNYDSSVHRLHHTGAGVDITWEPAISQPGTAPAQVMHADAVVVCAGVASRRFAAQLGDRVNIYPVKGYSITVPLVDEASRDGAPWVSLLDDGAKIVSSRFRDRLRVAGTAEFNGYNLDIRADRIRPLLGWTRDMFPAVDTSAAVPWAGAAADAAQHAAARRPRQTARRLLQHRPRPSRLDALRRDRRDGRGERRRQSRHGGGHADEDADWHADGHAGAAYVCARSAAGCGVTGRVVTWLRPIALLS